MQTITVFKRWVLMFSPRNPVKRLIINEINESVSTREPHTGTRTPARLPQEIPALYFSLAKQRQGFYRITCVLLE